MSNSVNIESLEAGYRLALTNPDHEKLARGIDLGLQSGLDADTALELRNDLNIPSIDWTAFAREAPTLSSFLSGGNAVMNMAAPHISELWRQEQQMHRWNVRRPGEGPAQDRLNTLTATLGSVYMGIKDIGRGLTAIHKDFVGEVQKTLRDVNLDEIPGLDDESRAMLQDLNNVDLEKVAEDTLPVFDWMKTYNQDVANASPFLRFASDVFRALPTTGAALLGGVVGGPMGAAAAGGSIIYGQSLDSYENDPAVTAGPEDRRLYALGNAVVQGALEAVGANGLLKAFKPRGARGKALKAWFEGTVKEGVTEASQEFPERFFQEMARGADPTDKEDLLHLLDVFTSSEFWKDAGYAGLVGAAAGGLVSAPGIHAQRRAFAAQEAAFAALPAMAKNFPNAYRAILRRHAEAGNVSREVFVPSAAVEGLFQEDATSQDIQDFLDKAGISPADYEVARSSGAPLSIPFENIADVLNDERGQALREQLDISPEQESAGAAVTAEIFESVQKGELSLENMPEDERALEEIREELGLDELALDERALLKQDVVDAIINATAGNENAYTAEQARAYADIINATVATFAATHGLTYRGAFNLVAPEFARGDISVEEMDALRSRVREAAASPEATEQNFALATNRGKTKKGQAAPRMTLEERAPLLALVRGRLDGKSLKRDFPDAYRELMQTHGRGLFRSAEKGGIAIDELADEAVSRGFLPQGAGSSELVEYLKAGRRELFQSAYHGTPHRFDEFSLDAIGTGEGNQAHGWGLYFAQERGTSEKYKTDLGVNITLDDKPFYDGVKGNLESSTGNEVADDTLLAFNGDIDEAIAELQDDVDYGVPEAVEALEVLQNIKADSRLKVEERGQLFEVDIPENDVLLDEQKPYYDQPETVRKAIHVIGDEFGGGVSLGDMLAKDWSGKGVYNYLRSKLGTDKAASLWLNEHGVKGITYNGGQDGRCFVVFDDKAIKVLDTYYQGQNNPRAAFSPVTEAKGIIRFFQSADISSAGHEIGHSLRRVLELGANMDNTPDFVQQDWETACAFVGAEPGATWTVAQEEKFADSFVDYLQKGNAPSAGLRRAFTRLARWLTELYRRIRGLDVNVSSEMSRVFDRLLATERELAAAKQRDGLEYMSTGIEDIPAEFLGGEDAKQIAEAVARADLDAQAAIHDKLARELRQHMAEWRRQATSFADSDPDQIRLDDLVKQGGLILPEELKARYGAEVVAAIRGKRVGKAIFSKDGTGVDVDMAADIWGFSGPSAVDDFMAHLAEIPTKKALRQQFMQDAFKAWRNTWTSDEVILTDGAARMLELEEVALAKAAGGQFRNEEVLRRKVTEEVLKLEIGQAEKALESLKTAARENSEAVRAIYRAKLKDKAAQALELKQKQRRAVAEIRERYKAKELRRKGVAQIQRMTRAKADVIDYEWLEQIRSVANRFGLGGRRGSVRTPERLKPLPEFLTQVQANFDTPIPVPAWLASVPARGMDWRRLTVEQFGELVDFIKWMDHQGREAKRLTVAGQKLNLDEALNAMTASMNSLKSKTAIADYEKKKLGWKALANLGRRYLAPITQFEYVFKAADGFRKGVEEMEGPHVKYIVRPLYEARSAEMGMLHDAGVALDDIMKPFRDKAGIARSKERWAMPDVPLPERVKKRWGALPWTYERVLMVALNMGNDGNRAALKGGFGWDDVQLARITDSLTAEDWTMVQRIWDYIDRLYPQLDAAYQAVNGLPMKKVKARRVQTKFGMLKGGYFPLVFDQALSDRAAQQQETDAMMNGAAALIRSVKPSDGFTMDRKGGKLPPKLSLSVLSRHIQDTCHYATHAPVIHNIRKITQNKGFRDTLEDKFGEDVLVQLQPWLNNIARLQRQELTGIEQFVEWGRQMATIQALGLKLTTSMMQLTSFSASAQEIGWKAVGEGLAFIGQNRSSAYETIRSLSPMMRDRAQTINTDLARSMDRLNPDRRSLAWEYGGKTYEASWNDVQKAVFAPMTFCDSIVAYSTWWGAYQKALRETEGDQKAAVTYADRAVALAQSSGNAVNLSTLQQATGYKKLITMFMTYTMNLQNRIRFQTRGLMEGMISPAQYMEYMFNDVAVPAIAAMILKAVLAGGDVPDDPKEYMKELGYYMLSGFPIIRDVQSLYEYGGDISLVNSSISRGFSAPFMATRAAYKWWTADSSKKEDAALFSFIKYMGETAGFAAGIPSRPIFQFFQGASDIVNGKTGNLFALFVKQKDEKKKK